MDNWRRSVFNKNKKMDTRKCSEFFKFTAVGRGVAKEDYECVEESEGPKSTEFEDGLRFCPALKRLDLLKLLHKKRSEEGMVSDMKEVLKVCPRCNETVLHVAVRHGCDEAVGSLVDWLRQTTYYSDIINSKDCCGQTVLHLATSRKQLQTLKLLLEDSPTNGGMVEVNAKNNGGFTALDILDVLPDGGEIDVEIEKVMRKSGALRGRDVFEQKLDKSNHEVLVDLGKQWHQSSPPQATKSESLIRRYPAALITATLLATMTFHAALRPPAGLSVNIPSYESSSAFQVETQDTVINNLYFLFNSIAFFTSVALITILMHELLIKPWLLISVFSTIGAYMCSIMIVSPHQVVTVFFIGSSILLAAFLNCLALHDMVLNYFEWLCIRIHPI